MWRRKQEERGVFFWFFSKKTKKTHLSPKTPFPLASKNGFHISKKLIATNADGQTDGYNLFYKHNKIMYLKFFSI